MNEMTTIATASIILIGVLLCLCLTVLGCDLMPSALDWLKRIHIGRYSDIGHWQSSAEKVAKKQINKLPAMPVTDRESFTIIPRIKGSYKNRDFLCWQEACLLLGLEEDGQAKAAAKQYFDKANVLNRHYTVGNIMLLYALLKSGFENDKSVKAAADGYIKKIFELSANGTLPYQPGGKNRFVDTLGMVCPFLMLYDRLYGCEQATALAKKQLDEFYEYGIHERTGLPIHCYNADTKAPLGVYGWGRGCGWLAIALADCYSVIDKTDDYSSVLARRIEAFADAIIKYQNGNGSFSCIFGTASREDSSATAFLGWFLTQAYVIKRDEKYASAANKSLKYVMSATRRDGTVDFAQGDTMGVGNYSRRFEPMPAAQGFALRLARFFKNKTEG